MRKAMCGLVMAGMLLAWGQAVLAGVVGQNITQTETFRQYVNTNAALTQKIGQLDADIAKERREISQEDRGWLQLVAPLAVYGQAAYALTLFGLLVMVLYVVYLVKWHPGKWRLATSARTLGLLRDKLLRRNGVISLLVLVSALVCSPALADTNVLQDLSMYYTGNQFEKGYLQCKYAKGPVALGYDAVGGVPVIPRPEPGFERAYDLVAHLLGLGRSVTAGEFVALYDQTRNAEQRRVAFLLSARAPKAVAQAVGEGIIAAICAQRGLALAACIDQFRALLSAFGESDNRLLESVLVKTFLEQAAGRIRDLEGLDALVTLAVDHGALAVIRDPVAKALQVVPPHLSFADTVYAARVLFHLDKDRARAAFASIRFALRAFVHSRELSEKLAGLMRELSGVAAFLPLYDNDALYKALQQQPNAVRVAITGLFDTVDKSLAAVAFDSIGTGENDLVFRESGTLLTFARLAAAYAKDKTAQLRTTLARSVVEHSVPYTREQLFAAVTALGQSPAAFVEDVLAADMQTDAHPGRNDALRLALIETLAPERIPAYEAYFAKHKELAEGLLPILLNKDRAAFYRLLDHVFAENPDSIARLRLPNDIFDLKAVAPAFTPKALESFASVPASLLYAQHALAGGNPDIKLVRRALIPVFDGLFRDFLTGEPKLLSQEQALKALVLLSVVEEPGGGAFKEEAFLLGKLLEDYFSGAIGNRQVGLKSQLEDRERTLVKLRQDQETARALVLLSAVEEPGEGGFKGDAFSLGKWLKDCFGGARRAGLKSQQEDRERTLVALQKDQETARALVRLAGYLRFYSVVLALYLAGGAILSLLFACNRLVPGKNFYLLHGVFGFADAFAAFLMATLVFFPLGFVIKLVAQLLLAKGASTPDLAECVAVLERGYRPKAEPETL